MSEISILCITDTHNYVRNMNLLKEKLKKEKKIYDLVIHTGDFDSIKNDDLNNFFNLPLKEREEADEKVKLPLSIFKEFSKSGTVIFITGNHDSRNFENKCLENDSYYNNVKFLENDSFILLNNSILRLNTEMLFKGIHPKYHDNYDIEILGFGGSIPAMSKLKTYFNYDKNFEYKLIYDGYPYENISTFEDDYLTDLKKLFSYREDQKRRYILLTHSGPIGLTSSTYNNENNYIDMGSSSFYSFLQYEENMIFNLHGHCHDSQGRDNINNSLIINPGSLLLKQYCEIILEKNIIHDIYKVKKTKFYNF